MKLTPFKASSGDVVADSSGGSLHSDRWVGFLCSVLMVLATSGRLHRIVTVKPFRAMTLPNAVPKVPEPKTQTLMLPRVGSVLGMVPHRHTAAMEAALAGRKSHNRLECQIVTRGSDMAH